MQQLRIVYMGTPDFAVEPLRRLLDHGCQVVGVVTMPDKPVGRHQHTLTASPVKAFALSRGLPVLQPEKLKAPEFLEALEALHADLQIVVAFRMLPEVVWGMPPRGTFNLHAALLPQYRGAAPINWAIIHGEKRTGVTTYFLDHDIDTGLIIDSAETPISDDDNVETVHDRLMDIGADLVVRTVERIAEGQPLGTPQAELMPGTPLRHAPKIFKDDCRIDWHQGVRGVHNFVRGLSPVPAAWTTLHAAGRPEQVLKIYRTTVEECPVAEPAGTLVSDNRTSLKVACPPTGYLHLHELQLAGKRRMQVSEFLNGFRPAEGDKLE